MKVLVLSTLHQFHGHVDYYTYEDLERIIWSFSPDILAVELRPSDVEGRVPQRIKQEYQKSVYPLIDKLKCEVIPLEPAEPKYSELIQMARESMENVQKNNPEALEHFKLYVEALYEVLFQWWSSVLDVNSYETDRHFEIKRRYQNSLFGDKEGRAWEEWNRHFLEQILKANEGRKDGKMLVLVGAEHSYWLRGELRKRHDVQLLEAPEVLPDIIGSRGSRPGSGKQEFSPPQG
ncbi:hypothetical protein E3E38_10120 [Thermococcus sp. 18S1]|uniref:hypothetical protein n=1 Tax=Thermococcus sp. 18S1 TaxID=1638210 RepID=UPI00143914C1|nr:hypothetical protein [Thermococcus sp. 18S1]NJE31397.1 hypothetical protein [Thermococcus sp. 18S1]